jgi:hypothetical protein
MDSHSPLLALSKGGFGLRLGSSQLCLFKNRLKELDWEMTFGLELDLEEGRSECLEADAL